MINRRPIYYWDKRRRNYLRDDSSTPHLLQIIDERTDEIIRDDWRKSRGNESHYQRLNPENQENGEKRNGVEKDEERIKKQIQFRKEELNCFKKKKISRLNEFISAYRMDNTKDAI